MERRRRAAARVVRQSAVVRRGGGDVFLRRASTRIFALGRRVSGARLRAPRVARGGVRGGVRARRDHGTPAEGALGPTQAVARFGGRTVIPDDQARILQKHPRMDTVDVRARNAAATANTAAAGVSAHGGVRIRPEAPPRARRVRARVRPGGRRDGAVFGERKRPRRRARRRIGRRLRGHPGHAPRARGRAPGSALFPKRRHAPRAGERFRARDFCGGPSRGARDSRRRGARRVRRGTRTRRRGTRAPRANAPMGGVGAASRGRRGRATLSTRGHVG